LLGWMKRIESPENAKKKCVICKALYKTKQTELDYRRLYVLVACLFGNRFGTSGSAVVQIAMQE